MKLKELYANATREAILFLLILNKFGHVVFRDSSFVRMTERRKMKLKDLFANATREAILFLLFKINMGLLYSEILPVYQWQVL